MHPFRELPRRRPRAWLLGMRIAMGRDRRGPGRLQDRSARDLAAVAASALAAGAALEFFLDPRSGKRRRQLVRDRTRAAFRRQARKIERQAHYEAGKIAGVAHTIKHHEHAISELDDVSLVRKGGERAVPRSNDSQGPDQHQRRPRDRGPPWAARRCRADPAYRAQRARCGWRPRRGEPAPPARRPGAGKPFTRRPTRDARRIATARTRSAALGSTLTAVVPPTASIMTPRPRRERRRDGLDPKSHHFKTAQEGRRRCSQASGAIECTKGR
jgi:hypothetical protein